MSLDDLTASFAATQNEEVIKSATASLRLYTHEKSISFISEALGCQPTAFRLADQPVYHRNPEGPKFTDSLWRFSSSLPDTEPLDEHVGYLCEFLRERMAALNAIGSRLCAKDIFCMFSSENGQGACAVSSDHMGVLAACGMELIIDLYPPTPGVWDELVESVRPFL